MTSQRGIVDVPNTTGLATSMHNAPKRRLIYGGVDRDMIPLVQILLDMPATAVSTGLEQF